MSKKNEIRGMTEDVKLKQKIEREIWKSDKLHMSIHGRRIKIILVLFI